MNMIKRLLILVIILLGNFAFAQSADEKAIKKTIEGEKAAADAADYKTYLAHWAKVPHASFLYAGGLFVGEALWKKMDEVWATRKPRKVNNIRSEWNIRVNGASAFVTFFQRQETVENNGIIESYEERYMEKINSEWKIVNVTVWGKPTK